MPLLRYDKLPAIEQAFNASNASRLEPINYAQGTPDEFQVLLFKSPNIYHFNEKHDKKRIVLHFTAGGLPGDMETLTKPNSFVSVPFVVSRDGTIYQLFPSKYWAYSLGMSTTDGDNKNHKLHKSCVAIELSNFGPLELKPNTNILRKAKMRASDPNIDYCTLEQPEAYQLLTNPFRNFEYYATYTNEQINSLIKLAKWLCVKYSIPSQILPLSSRYIWDQSVQPFNGITSHVNYRQSGKWDIGPEAFNWPSFETGIAINSQVGVDRSVRSGRTRSVEIDKVEDKKMRGKVRGVKYSEGVEEKIK